MKKKVVLIRKEDAPGGARYIPTPEERMNLLVQNEFILKGTSFIVFK